MSEHWTHPDPDVRDLIERARAEGRAEGARILDEHRQFGAGCTGCDWISDDITLSLRADHRVHVATLLGAS